MATVARSTTTRNRQPARSDAHATLPNRNNTSFKTPRNALTINLVPNPNRNKNSVRPGFTFRRPRIANHDSRRSRPACPGGRIALRRGRLLGTQITNRHASFTNYHSPITNHTPFAHDVTLLHPRFNRHTTSVADQTSSQFNRQPRRLEFAISHRKQTLAPPINRQLFDTLENAFFAPRATFTRAAAKPFRRVGSRQIRTRAQADSVASWDAALRSDAVGPKGESRCSAIHKQGPYGRGGRCVRVFVQKPQPSRNAGRMGHPRLCVS